MTAEIAIINRQAVALAADSAVTIGKERVWKNSNKLFSLGPHNDIGVMIYGSGEFVGFPWELLIKTFRTEIAQQEFDTVRECGEAFMAFLAQKRFVADDMREVAQLGMFVDGLEFLKKRLKKYSSKAEFKHSLSAICDSRIKEISDVEEIGGAPTLKEFCRVFEKDVIGPFAKDIFGEIMPKKLCSKISATLFETYRRRVTSNYSTGVVFAGYGQKEFFGSLINYVVDGKDGLLFRHWINGLHDSNQSDEAKTVIIPFAQKDMFQLFMEGISQRYIRFLEGMMRSVLDEKSNKLISDFVRDKDEQTVEKALQKKDNSVIIEQFLEAFEDYRSEKVIAPILDVVRALPKEEMADMAHALVELTSLKRKVDSAVETVGGPVDVAVITKADGLIWVKRKHYFKLEGNQDFLYRKEAKMRRRQ